MMNLQEPKASTGPSRLDQPHVKTSNPIRPPAGYFQPQSRVMPEQNNLGGVYKEMVQLFSTYADRFARVFPKETYGKIDDRPVSSMEHGNMDMNSFTSMFHKSPDRDITSADPKAHLREPSPAKHEQDLKRPNSDAGNQEGLTLAKKHKIGIENSAATSSKKNMRFEPMSVKHLVNLIADNHKISAVDTSLSTKGVIKESFTRHWNVQVKPSAGFISKKPNFAYEQPAPMEG